LRKPAPWWTALTLFATSALAAPIVLICVPGSETPVVVPTPPDEPNTAPTWSIPDRSIQRTSSCALDLTTVTDDAENDTLTYTLVSGSLPTGCSLVGSSLTGTANTNGTYNFVLGANDGNSVTLREASATTAPLSWTSEEFTPAQTGMFDFAFTITPSGNNIDHVCGYGTQAISAYAHTLVAIRLNTAGNFDARNNASYTAVNTIAYSAGVSYNITGRINVEAGTADISVNGTVLADDYVFRGGALPGDLEFFGCADAATPGVVGTAVSAISLTQPVMAPVTYTVFAETDSTPPSAPSAPTVSGVTQTTVTLSLPASGAGDHSYYRVERSPSGCGAYAQIADNVTDATYTDTGRTQNTAYCYRLVDVDTAGNASSAGSGVTATTSSVDVNALLSLGNTSVLEGNSGTASLSFTLTSSASQAFNIVCSYQTLGGTAESSTDFVAASGTVQIDSGTTTEPIAITVNGDTTQEPDETLTLRVYNCGQNGTAVNATEFTATGTITNDDGTANIATSAQSSVTQYGITWTFNTTYQVGQFVNGDYFVINPGAGVVVNSVSPTPITGRHGSMRNPAVPSSQGFDDRSYAYNASLRVAFPVTLATNDVLISTISQLDDGPQWDGANDDSKVNLATAAILTVLSSSPPVGTFRPSYADPSKTLYNASSINTAVLPRLSTTGMPNPNSSGFANALERNKRAIERPWLMFGSNFNSRGIHPALNMDGYHREVSEVLSELYTYLASDKTIDETLLIRVVQLGIDFYHVGTRGNADSSFWVPPILIAGKLINNSNMLNLFTTGISNLKSVPRDFADFYIWSDPWRGANNVEPGGPNPSRCPNVSVPLGETYNGYTVFFRNNLGNNRDYEHLTPSERLACGIDNNDDSYRNDQDSHPHVGMVFAGLAFDLVDEWDHYATFAYIDRWMQGENQSSSDDFVDAMYETHRDSFQAFDWLASTAANDEDFGQWAAANDDWFDYYVDRKAANDR